MTSAFPTRAIRQSLDDPGQFSNFPTVEIDELGLNIGPEGNSPQSSIQNTYQVLNNLSYIVGRHQIKGGIEYRNWISPGDFLPRSRGEWDYATMSEFINDLVPNGYEWSLARRRIRILRRQPAGDLLVHAG